jgi:hypothetical protein
MTSSRSELGTLTSGDAPALLILLIFLLFAAYMAGWVIAGAHMVAMLRSARKTREVDQNLKLQTLSWAFVCSIWCAVTGSAGFWILLLYAPGIGLTAGENALIALGAGIPSGLFPLLCTGLFVYVLERLALPDARRRRAQDRSGG